MNSNNIDNIGKFFMLGIYSLTELIDDDKEALETIKPASIIFFQRNIYDLEQTQNLINQISTFLGYKPLIAIDQEGGLVSRLERGFNIAPSAMAFSWMGYDHGISNRSLSSRNDNNSNKLIGDKYFQSQINQELYHASSILAREMKLAGIDWNLAPVVDINSNHQNPGIGIRSFSEDKFIVTSFASVFLKAMKDNGIISCVKHFPGLGRVDKDAHLDMPILNVSSSDLHNEELYPYMNLEAPTLMPTHMYVPALQNKVESITVSYEVLTSFIREKIGYNGVLISDDITMRAITNSLSIPDASYQSFYAGMDMISICHDKSEQLKAFHSLKEKIKKINDRDMYTNEVFITKVRDSSKKINKLFELRDRYSLSVNRNIDLSQNKVEMNSILYRSICIIKNQNSLLPLKNINMVLSMALSRKTAIDNETDRIPLIAKMIADDYKLKVNLVDFENINDSSSDNRLNLIILQAKNKDIIFFSENAHLNKIMRESISNIALQANSLLLICLRNPYDADIDGVEDAICSFGYMKAQQKQLYKFLK